MPQTDGTLFQVEGSGVMLCRTHAGMTGGFLQERYAHTYERCYVCFPFVIIANGNPFRFSNLEDACKAAALTFEVSGIVLEIAEERQ